jgi:hypothetical protein
MIIIGVDPGISDTAPGAIAFITPDGAHVYDLPRVSDKSLVWIDGGALLSLILQHPGNRTAVVERVSCRPGQGVSGVLNSGAGFGAIMASLQGVQCPIELVTPSKWKAHYGLSDDKQASIDRARLLFPTCDLGAKKNHGRAEALLIAHWYQTRAMRAAA